MLLYFLVLLLVALPLFFLLSKQTKNGHFHPPPGPKGLPLIGNLHQFDRSAPHLYLSNLAKIYGPILSLRFGRVPTVVVQSAKAAKEVLKTQDHNFCSRPQMVGQQKLSYNGLDIAFVPYSDYFKEMKKLCIVHLFSAKRVQSFAPIRKDEVLRMINLVSSLSSSSKIVNLSDLFMAFSTSVICRVAFGKRYEDEGVERSKFHNLVNETQAMFVAPFFSTYFPLMGWLDKLTGLSERLETLFTDLDVFYEEIINEHLHQNEPHSADKEDIIDVLLQLQKQRSFTFELTSDHIKAVLMDIFVAGTDTSAAMLVWAMTELIKNPNAMRKVQEELRTLYQDKSFIEEDDLHKLEYLKAVVKETFRLHPAAPLLVRETLQKCNIQGYDIEPKTLVYVNVWAIGRDPESWNDPELFMPERFLGSNRTSIDYKGKDFELIPFGAGKRMCPGMLLGITKVELALANMLLSFDWELPVGMKKEDVDIDVFPGLTMHKKNPLCLVAKKLP